MLICAPMIGQLFLRPRLWAWRRVVAGVYGPVSTYGGRALWVQVRAVEAAHGVTFTLGQLEAVGVYIPEWASRNQLPQPAREAA